MKPNGATDVTTTALDVQQGQIALETVEVARRSYMTTQRIHPLIFVIPACSLMCLLTIQFATIKHVVMVL
jgi:hypothetical protein